MLVKEKQKIETYYQALLERKESFVGIFYVGVKTTSIFCIATCRARKPKFENVEFYTEAKDALDNGYRPCKICRPIEHADSPPPQVLEALRLVHANPAEKISDATLDDLGLNSVFIRRWFKKHCQMTFQSYQRMYRLNTASEALKKGKRTTDAAYDIGYESLSGFGHTFKKVFGNSPSKKTENIVIVNRLTTKLGPMFIGATGKGLFFLEFANDFKLESEIEKFRKKFKVNIIAGENEHIKQARVELDEYFNGTRKQFDVNLDLSGTEFQQRVWNALLQIDYGQTISYQEQADRMKKTKAVRAVASANGANRLAIIIPCHRVIGKNGKLTGYAGGLERKAWLLDHEKANR